MTRNTVQKTIVYDTVCQMHEHPSADSVYELVLQKCPNISKATVYRILNNLADSGKILRVKVPDGADRYDFNTLPHHHIKCGVCGRVGDVFLKNEPLLNAVSTDNYSITGYKLAFDGLCPDCRK